MSTFLVFMAVFFMTKPSRLPVYMIADILQVSRQLGQRLKSFRRYRKITKDMERLFPAATIEARKDSIIRKILGNG
jgi:E3 ubiquitin-protein ligase synoviolin